MATFIKNLTCDYTIGETVDVVLELIKAGKSSDAYEFAKVTTLLRFHTLFDRFIENVALMHADKIDELSNRFDCIEDITEVTLLPDVYFNEELEYVYEYIDEDDDYDEDDEDDEDY